MSELDVQPYRPWLGEIKMCKISCHTDNLFDDAKNHAGAAQSCDSVGKILETLPPEVSLDVNADRIYYSSFLC